MAPRQDLSRRHLLASLPALSVLAGCADDGDAAESDDGDVADSAAADEQEADSTIGNDEEETTPDTDDDENVTSEDGSDDADSELDLREANVVDVAFEKQDETYTFDVTLHHDDDGEDGYANWWQIERLDGRRLGRRELLHAHSQQPFTRSETIEITADVTCVVVRGHDRTHEYGGRAMVIDLDSKATRAVEQGSQSRSFGTGDCP